MATKGLPSLAAHACSASRFIAVVVATAADGTDELLRLRA
jgi:hypothetical protein